MHSLCRPVLSLLAFASIVTTLGCSGASGTARDEAAIRAIDDQYVRAYAARDANAILGLYADDAVVYAPGAGERRGRADIRDFVVNDEVPSAIKSGLHIGFAPGSEVGVADGLGWEAGKIFGANETGAVVWQIKYVIVTRKVNDHWLIIRDIWNADAPAALSSPKS